MSTPPVTPESGIPYLTGAEIRARFVEFFVAAGRDLNAPGPGNKSILKLVSEHRQGAEYAQILKDAGAQ